MIKNIYIIMPKVVTDNNLEPYILFFDEVVSASSTRECGYNYVSVVETFASKEQLDDYLYTILWDREIEHELLFSDDYLELCKYDDMC